MATGGFVTSAKEPVMTISELDLCANPTDGSTGLRSSLFVSCYTDIADLFIKRKV